MVCPCPKNDVRADNAVEMGTSQTETLADLRI